MDDILVKVDRASMLCSLEVRAPFLDARLIDLAFRRLPDRLRATARERKILLAAAGRSVCCPQVWISLASRGSRSRLPPWFKGDWGRFIEDVLTSRVPLICSIGPRSSTLLDRATRRLWTTRIGCSRSR